VRRYGGEKVFRKLFWMLKEPEEFFEGVRKEGYREPFFPPSGVGGHRLLHPHSELPGLTEH